MDIVSCVIAPFFSIFSFTSVGLINWPFHQAKASKESRANFFLAPYTFSYQKSSILKTIFSIATVISIMGYGRILPKTIMVTLSSKYR